MSIVQNSLIFSLQMWHYCDIDEQRFPEQLGQQGGGQSHGDVLLAGADKRDLI